MLFFLGPLGSGASHGESGGLPGGGSPPRGCLPGRGKVHFFFCGKRNGP